MSNNITQLQASERPLVTFALFAYNQEKYIKEAVEGVLAQTYSPLEIILSDDFSTDRTFEIMKEMVENYSGNHLIQLNKNDKNLGIGAHVDKIDRMAQGCLIIHAAGDDISHPERTTTLANAWSEEIIKPSLLISNGCQIDYAGNIVSNNIVNLNKQIFDRPIDKYTRSLPFIGCSIAISNDLVKKFDPLPHGLIAEDAVLYRRAYLLNGIKYIPNKILKYRVGPGVGISSTNSDSAEEYIAYSLKWEIDSKLRWVQIKKDMMSLNYANEKVVRDIKHRLLISNKKVSIITNKNIYAIIESIYLLLMHFNFIEILSILKISTAIFTPKLFLILRVAVRRIKILISRILLKLEVTA